jgi:hypothetical protein
MLANGWDPRSPQIAVKPMNSRRLDSQRQRPRDSQALTSTTLLLVNAGACAVAAALATFVHPPLTPPCLISMPPRRSERSTVSADISNKCPISVESSPARYTLHILALFRIQDGVATKEAHSLEIPRSCFG